MMEERATKHNTSTPGPEDAEGWILQEYDYGALHAWRRDGTFDTAVCRAGADSLDRAQAMLASGAGAVVRVHAAGTTRYDAYALGRGPDASGFSHE